MMKLNPFYLRINFTFENILSLNFTTENSYLIVYSTKFHLRFYFIIKLYYVDEFGISILGLKLAI